MTRDEIMRLARVAGFTDTDTDDNGVWIHAPDYWTDEIIRFAALVAAAEREACAQVADKYAEGPERNYSELIADAIRARGEKK